MEYALGQVNIYLAQLNQSPILIGLAMVLLNIGSRYILMDITPSQEMFLASPFFRRMLLFIVFFMATRDIAVSLVMTLGYIVIVGNLLNEKSPQSVIPQKQATMGDRPKPDEVESARKILRAAELAERRDTEIQRVHALENMERNRRRRQLLQA